MITIIHGEDTQASRNYYYQQRSQVSDAIILDGVALKIEDIAQNLSSNNLFGDEKHIFVEELLSKRKASTESKEIIEYILKHHESIQIYLWESKELTASQLKSFIHVTTKQFKLPQAIFLFLDNIRPKNNQTLITLLHKTLEHKDDQFIFFMLIRHVRILLALSNKTSDTNIAIDEVKRMASWQKTKLLKQASLFSREHLIEIYNTLFTLDVAQKTGGLACPISQSIDFLLSEM